LVGFEQEMDSAPITVRETDPVDLALELFTKMRLRHLCVLAGEKPASLLTRHDLHPHAVTHSMVTAKFQADNKKFGGGGGLSPRSNGNPGDASRRSFEPLTSPSRPAIQLTTINGDGLDVAEVGGDDDAGLGEADDVFLEQDSPMDLSDGRGRAMNRKLSLNFVM
jgi:hypothetical protein